MAREPTDAAAGIDQLYDATCSAACLPHLRGNTSEQVEARTAAAAVATLPVAAVARLLRASRTAVRRLVGREPVPGLVEAITRQLHLRAHLPRLGPR
ncbi:MAG: hypothetical protein GY898_16370 [Proteobacteria bacterium]|nr:hypothetical protein [Pseudomonadota bacterium]